jgi:hypothetical protein
MWRKHNACTPTVKELCVILLLIGCLSTNRTNSSVCRQDQRPLSYITTCYQKKNKSKAAPLLAMQELRGRGSKKLYILLILDLGARWGSVVSVTPRPTFSPGERTAGTHCTGSWVGPRAGLDTEARGKILCLSLDRTPIVQSVVRHCTDWSTPASNQM